MSDHFENRTPLILATGFRAEGLSQLRAYIDLLWSANEELNLVSRQMTFEDLIDNHVLDCLLPLSFFPKTKVVADFGAGGGLPGVLYALQFPETRFRLYEKSPKKREFLNRCRVIAPNLEVLSEIPLALKEIELVTARGFKPIDVILDMSRKYFDAGGKYFLLKGRREKIDEEITLARKKFKTLECRVDALHSPVLEVERHLVQI